MGVRYLEAYDNSKLIVNQVKGEYEVRHEDLVPNHHAVIKTANSFDGFFIGHVSWFQNTKADALAVLALHWPYLLTQLIILQWPLDALSALSMCWKQMKSM